MQGLLLRDGWKTTNANKLTIKVSQQLYFYMRSDRRHYVLLTSLHPECCTRNSSRTPTRRFHMKSCTVADWCSTCSRERPTELTALHGKCFGASRSPTAWRKAHFTGSLLKNHRCTKYSITISGGPALSSVWSPPARREERRLAGFGWVCLTTSSSWCCISSRCLKHSTSPCTLSRDWNYSTDLQQISERKH